LPAEHDLLDIVVAVELQPQELDELDGALAVDPPRGDVGLVVGLQDLIEPADGVGVDVVLAAGDGMREPDGLNRLEKRAGRLSGNTVARVRHLLEFGSASRVSARGRFGAGSLRIAPAEAGGGVRHRRGATVEDELADVVRVLDPARRELGIGLLRQGAEALAGREAVIAHAVVDAVAAAE